MALIISDIVALWLCSSSSFQLVSIYYHDMMPHSFGILCGGFGWGSLP